MKINKDTTWWQEFEIDCPIRKSTKEVKADETRESRSRKVKLDYILKVNPLLS